MPFGGFSESSVKKSEIQNPELGKSLLGPDQLRKVRNGKNPQTCFEMTIGYKN